MVFSSISIPYLLFSSSRNGAVSSSFIGANIPFSLMRPSRTIKTAIAHGTLQCCQPPPNLVIKQGGEDRLTRPT